MFTNVSQDFVDPSYEFAQNMDVFIAQSELHMSELQKLTAHVYKLADMMREVEKMTNGHFNLTAEAVDQITLFANQMQKLSETNYSLQTAIEALADQCINFADKCESNIDDKLSDDDTDDNKNEDHDSLD